MAVHEEIYVPPAVKDLLPEEVVRRAFARTSGSQYLKSLGEVK
jgi:hypothetical protein